MTVVLMLLFGAGLGLGVVLLLEALKPTSQPIDEVFAAIDRPGVSFSARPDRSDRSLRSMLVSLGTTFSLGDEHRLHRDLAVTGSSTEQHALVKGAAPAVVLILTYLIWVGLALVRLRINPVLATTGALVAAIVAFVIPDLRLRSQARRARVAFRHALSAYLDLVTIIISGGGGLLTALQAAADAGDGPAFAEIRAALDRARLSNRTPWSQLGLLGERFDIAEIRDLVAAADLAGTEGARISESVATKADVLRARLQAEVEQTSESLTEQMLLPVGLLLTALFLFLGFAVAYQLSPGSDRTFDPQALAPLLHWRAA